jgi:hypothetical protein
MRLLDAHTTALCKDEERAVDVGECCVRDAGYARTLCDVVHKVPGNTMGGRGTWALVAVWRVSGEAGRSSVWELLRRACQVCTAQIITAIYMRFLLHCGGVGRGKHNVSEDAVMWFDPKPYMLEVVNMGVSWYAK